MVEEKALNFAITCDDEPSVLLSNERREESWDTLNELALALLRSSGFASESVLFAWKREKHHLASVRESYAWRSVLEEIKNANLPENCQEFRADSQKFILITDKPVMLKIAGEITNSLLHSYTLRHHISFVPVHRESKDPS